MSTACTWLEETPAKEVGNALGNTADVAQSLELEVDADNVKKLIDLQEYELTNMELTKLQKIVQEEEAGDMYIYRYLLSPWEASLLVLPRRNILTLSEPY